MKLLLVMAMASLAELNVQARWLAENGHAERADALLSVIGRIQKDYVDSNQRLLALTLPPVSLPAPIKKRTHLDLN